MDLSPSRFGTLVIAILIVGLGTSALIWLVAGEPQADPLGESRMYVHDMVLYGGKTNMVLGELAQWLGSLWHGKRLAGTLAIATLLAAAIFWYFFAPAAHDAGDDASGD